MRSAVTRELAEQRTEEIVRGLVIAATATPLLADAILNCERDGVPEALEMTPTEWRRHCAERAGVSIRSVLTWLRYRRELPWLPKDDFARLPEANARMLTSPAVPVAERRRLAKQALALKPEDFRPVIARYDKLVVAEDAWRSLPRDLHALLREQIGRVIAVLDLEPESKASFVTACEAIAAHLAQMTDEELRAALVGREED